MGVTGLQRVLRDHPRACGELVDFGRGESHRLLVDGNNFVGFVTRVFAERAASPPSLVLPDGLGGDLSDFAAYIRTILRTWREHGIELVVIMDGPTVNGSQGEADRRMTMESRRKDRLLEQTVAMQYMETLTPPTVKGKVVSVRIPSTREQAVACFLEEGLRVFRAIGEADPALIAEFLRAAEDPDEQYLAILSDDTDFCMLSGVRALPLWAMPMPEAASANGEPAPGLETPASLQAALRPYSAGSPIGVMFSREGITVGLGMLLGCVVSEALVVDAAILAGNDRTKPLLHSEPWRKRPDRKVLPKYDHKNNFLGALDWIIGQLPEFRGVRRNDLRSLAEQERRVDVTWGTATPGPRRPPDVRGVIGGSRHWRNHVIKRAENPASHPWEASLHEAFELARREYMQAGEAVDAGAERLEEVLSDPARAGIMWRELCASAHARMARIGSPGGGAAAGGASTAWGEGLSIDDCLAALVVRSHVQATALTLRSDAILTEWYLMEPYSSVPNVLSSSSVTRPLLSMLLAQAHCEDCAHVRVTGAFSKRFIVRVRAHPALSMCALELDSLRSRATLEYMRTGERVRHELPFRVSMAELASSAPLLFWLPEWSAEFHAEPIPKTTPDNQDEDVVTVAILSRAAGGVPVGVRGHSALPAVVGREGPVYVRHPEVPADGRTVPEALQLSIFAASEELAGACRVDPSSPETLPTGARGGVAVAALGLRYMLHWQQARLRARGVHGLERGFSAPVAASTLNSRDVLLTEAVLDALLATAILLDPELRTPSLIHVMEEVWARSELPAPATAPPDGETLTVGKVIQVMLGSIQHAEQRPHIHDLIRASIFVAVTQSLVEISRLAGEYYRPDGACSFPSPGDLYHGSLFARLLFVRQRGHHMEEVLGAAGADTQDRFTCVKRSLISDVIGAHECVESAEGVFVV